MKQVTNTQGITLYIGRIYLARLDSPQQRFFGLVAQGQHLSLWNPITSWFAWLICKALAILAYDTPC